MKRRPPVSKRTATRFPYTTLVRSAASGGVTLRQGIAAGRRCRWYGAKHGSTLESFRSPDRDAERRVRALYARGREGGQPRCSARASAAACAGYGRTALVGKRLQKPHRRFWDAWGRNDERHPGRDRKSTRLNSSH